MAEVVEYRVEKGVKFLEELEKNAIFDEEEVRLIVKKRKEFEYRLQRPKKTKEDFLKYIAYEESLLKLIRLRRKRIGNFNNYKEIELDIAKKISFLYRKAVSKYQGDEKLWFSFISFCKRMKLTESIGSWYTRMIQTLSGNENVWLAAAKWHFEENDSPDIARELMLRALKHHEKSSLLWREYFRMELMYASMKKKEKEEEDSTTAGRKRKRDEEDGKPSRPVASESVLSGKIAIIVFNNAVKALEDTKPLLSMLSVLDEFESDLRVPVKDHVFKVLKEKFPDKEETLDIIARSYLDNAYLKHLTRGVEQENLPLKELKRLKIKESYENAVQQLNTERMWTLYIKFHLETLSKTSGKSREKALSDTLSTMERAWNNRTLSCMMFVEWILLTSASSSYSRLREVVTMGLEKWEHSATVWYVSLCVLSEKDSTLTKEIKQLFERAIKRLHGCGKLSQEENENLSVRPKSILDIFHLYIKWASIALTSREVLAILEKRIGDPRKTALQEKEIITSLKPILLEKCLELKEKGLEKARYYYEKYKLVYPVIPEFFGKMIEIELSQDTRDVEAVRKSFQDYTNHFGNSDHKIWLNWIKFELSLKDFDKVSKLYHQACKILTPEELHIFMCEYSLLNNPKARSIDTSC